MTFQIGDKAYLHNRHNLPPIFETEKPLKIHGVLQCPECHNLKLAVMSVMGTLHFLNAKRFTSIEDALKIAVQNQDYELAAKLRDERVSNDTPT